MAWSGPEKAGENIEFAAHGQTAVVRWIGPPVSELARNPRQTRYSFSQRQPDESAHPRDRKAGATQRETVTRKKIDAVAIKLPRQRI
jgi:hypothetical protein